MHVNLSIECLKYVAFDGRATIHLPSADALSHTHNDDEDDDDDDTSETNDGTFEWRHRTTGSIKPFNWITVTRTTNRKWLHQPDPLAFSNVISGVPVELAAAGYLLTRFWRFVCTSLTRKKLNGSWTNFERFTHFDPYTSNVFPRSACACLLHFRTRWKIMYWSYRNESNLFSLVSDYISCILKLCEHWVSKK